MGGRSDDPTFGRFGWIWISQLKIDAELPHALAKRWHPETQTFYLSRGEITVTLKSAQMILGLRYIRDRWLQIAWWRGKHGWRMLTTNGRVVYTGRDNQDWFTIILVEGVLSEETCWPLYPNDRRRSHVESQNVYFRV